MTRRNDSFHWFPVLFFPLGALYGELLLRLFDEENPFFDWALLRVILFTGAAGLLIYFLLDLIPNRKVSRGLGIAVISAGTVYTCIEYCCKSYFKTYFTVSYMGEMTGQVMSDFFGTMMEVIFARIPFILLSFVPLILFIWLRMRIFGRRGQAAPVRVKLVGAVIVLHVIGILMARCGGAAHFYTYDFTANTAVPQFGMVTSLRLEAQYAIFGMPEEPLPDIGGEGDIFDDPTEPPVSTGDPDPSGTDTDPIETTTPIVYGYNTLDIDFAGLAESEQDETIAALHKYFANKTPSQQNEYTGYFEGKNLILITAEAFSPYVIDPKLTPTLYKLTHEGFIFNNYYQPDWTQSTTGGEFAVMTGLIPTWSSGSSLSFRVSAHNNMGTALGWLFQNEGYSSMAWHNNTYTYYGRHETHPNLGYDYKGIDNGLVLPSDLWPCSDLEMFQATVSSYVDAYVEQGTNFHAYYMTVSGHANYNWSGNAMARKWKEEAQAAYPNASESVQAYIACNLEVEYALTYLMEQLESAGIADDTVIIMTADHYPYAMSEGDVDYYNELRGFEDSKRETSRYRNTLMMWCGSMDEPVVVDTPCSALDIVPTICNLFALDYDSRLYSGRDIFATNYVANEYSNCMPLVVFANTGFGNSWITAAGTYEASTRTFTPNPGIEVSDDYVTRVTRLVQAKYSYAKTVVQYDYYSYILPDPEK